MIGSRSGLGPVRRVLPTITLVAWAWVGCEAESVCDEDPRAQQLDESLTISLGTRMVTAEVADEQVERERGWKHRVCDRGGLLLIPDEAPAPLAVWGCDLVQPVWVVPIADGRVVDVWRLEPCPSPCGDCPILGEDLDVDAALELPIDAAAPSPGDPVQGI